MIDVLRTHQFDKREYPNEPATEVFTKNSMACVCWYVCVCNITNCKYIHAHTRTHKFTNSI